MRVWCAGCGRHQEGCKCPLFTMVDLFSGLGGASEPFLQSCQWSVVRVENTERCSHVPHTIIGDVRSESLINSLPSEPDLLWMSPPCTEFSLARHPKIKNPDMSLVRRCIEIVERLRPKYWVIENVKGAQTHFLPYLGKPRVVIDSKFYLWGNFPLFNALIPKHSKYADDGWSTDPFRSQKRAYVPFAIGEALRQTIQYQCTLESFQAKNV